MSRLQHGHVTYTERGFRQDSEDAMKGDIVRGILEAVTNADDAYRRLGSTRRGVITIEVEHRRQSPWVVRIRDRATGIPDLISELTDIGGRTSGFESGLDVRGNLGRGAKDLAAFGPVTFSTIVDDRYKELRLDTAGNWQEKANRKATADDREWTGIRRGNGTVVELLVTPSIRCPRHDTLKHRLTNHFELRSIISAPDREVKLVNLNDGTTDTLIYLPPESETVFEGSAPIDGYPGVECDVKIGRLVERSDDGASDPSRANGLVIRGTNSAYEVSLLGFESDFYAGWFAGEVRCPYIDDLQREYDDHLDRNEDPPPENPVRIISRQREGLRRDHPFVAALVRAIEEPLEVAVADERKRARDEQGRLETDSTRQAFEQVGQELARWVDEELRDIEAEELTGGLDEGLPPPLAVVPEAAYAYIGDRRTLTIAASRRHFVEGDLVQVSVDPGGVVELESSEVELAPHRRREDLLVGQIRLTALIANEMTMVTVRAKDRTAVAIVETREERVIPPDVVEVPDELEFERPSYRVGIGKQRSLLVRAPAELLESQGPGVKFSSGDPGVVVRTPRAVLEFDAALGFATASVLVEARSLGTAAVISASVGGIVATAAVKVTRKEEGPSIVPRLVDEDMGSFRGVMVRETDPHIGEHMVLKVSTRHRAMRPYFGDRGQGQNSPACRSVIAEVMADTAARHIVGELYRSRRSTEEFDVDRFYREHYRRVARLLPPLQRILMGAPDVAWTAEELEPSELFKSEAV